MYTLPRYNYLRPRFALPKIIPSPKLIIPPELLDVKNAMKKSTKAKQLNHKDRVKNDLKNLGMSKIGLLSREGRHLHNVIHLDEKIGGVVYGHHPDGFAMLVATDSRVIFIDIKPFFINEDEVSYDVISGVTFGRVAHRSTVTLHTRVKDYPILVFNQICARGFIEYIESRCLENKTKNGGASYD